VGGVAGVKDCLTGVVTFGLAFFAAFLPVLCLERVSSMSVVASSVSSEARSARWAGVGKRRRGLIVERVRGRSGLVEEVGEVGEGESTGNLR